jgi:uncharacterized protein (DUF2141 family)
VTRIALVLGIVSIALAASAQVASSARLVVDVSALRNDGGRIGCLLFASRTGFPTEPSRAVAHAEASPSARRGRCVFENVAPGTYAVAVHHDEDGDGVFDTGIFGIPLEGVGASRDARGNMGPPSFDDARIDVPAGETRIDVHVYYPM